MGAELTLSSTLQRRLVDALLERHPLPWRFQQESEWICEVIDAKKRLVLTCMKEDEAEELIEAAKALSNRNSGTDLEVDRVVQKVKTVSTRPKSALDLFDKFMPIALPIVLSQNADKAQELAASYYFKITSSSGEGGEWIVDCTGTEPSCKRAMRGDAGKSTCTIVVGSSDIMKIVKDPKAARELYFHGELSVIGDPRNLQSLFELLFPE